MQKKLFNFAIIAVLLSLQFTMIFGCMCGGPATCDENGNSATNETGGVCDCCPSCNTCDQLLTGCMDSRAFPNLDFEPSLPSSLIVGVNISHLLIIDNSTFQGITLGPVCIDQPLPEGLALTYDSYRMGYYLEGAPTKIQNATSYIVRATGNVGYVGIVIISLEITDPHGEAAAATTATQPATTSEITSASEPITTSSVTSSSVTTSVESVTTGSVSTSDITSQSTPVTTGNQPATTATQPATTATQPVVTTATQPVTTSRSRSSTTARSVTTSTMKSSSTSKQPITTQVLSPTTSPNSNNNISTGKNNISTGPSQPQQATTAKTLPSTPSPTIPLPEVPTSSSNIHGIMLLLTIVSIWMLI